MTPSTNAAPNSPTVRVAIYARVSSDQQAQEQTIESQLAALKERITNDGYELDKNLHFVDDGVSGATLMRPALERLRTLIARVVIEPTQIRVIYRVNFPLFAKTASNDGSERVLHFRWRSGLSDLK